MLRGKRVSTTLSEFLRKQAESLEAEAQRNKPVIEKWQNAIRKLFGTVRKWIEASDPRNLIKINDRDEEMTEPGLGLYTVPRMDLTVFGRWIGMIPKARKTVGTLKLPHKSAAERASGRIDITDQIRRYVLYWFEESDTWMIDDLHSEPRPFTKEEFEAALLSYLQ